MRSFIDSAKTSRNDLNRHKKCENNAEVITAFEHTRALDGNSMFFNIFQRDDVSSLCR